MSFYQTLNPYRKTLLSLAVTAVLLLSGGTLQAQVDPGPRPAGNTPRTFGGTLGRLRGPAIGPAPGTPFLANAIVDIFEPPDNLGNEGAGGVLAGSAENIQFWWSGLAFFGMEVTPDGADDVAGNHTILGLGPTFNGNSCFVCHSFPSIGGTAPAKNPQLAFNHEKDPDPVGCAANPGTCATNPKAYSFLSPTGPIREARVITGANGLPDGGVHDLFTITGRTDTKGCTVTQEDLDAQFLKGNLSFRIPTPTFGLGLVEALADENLIASFDGSAGTRALYGISGSFNRNGNDGTITRFGWKAQNKSLLLFAGEASNVELGLSNEIFPNERVHDNCIPNGLMEDTTHAKNTLFPGHGLSEGTTDQDIAGLVSSDIENFAIFMRFNGAPSECRFDSGVITDPVTGLQKADCKFINDGSPSALSVGRGEIKFEQIGCTLCHTEQFTTNSTTVPGLSGRTFRPFSDFALHNMGSGLADGVTQGLADGNNFRTAPLWGVGQRIFLLHDGRTTDMQQAILAHQSPGSEANTVIGLFTGSTASDQQDILNFLRSL